MGSRADGRLEVVFATDGNGIVAAHIAIVTLLEAMASRRATRVSVLVDDMTDAQRNILLGAAEGFPFAEVQVLDSAPAMAPYREVLEQKRLRNRWPMAMWARCFVDVLLPDVSGKLLYLDTDVYVADDVCRLLETPMEGNIFAASPETTRESSIGQDGRYNRLGLSDSFLFYFNSGVMVFDMAEYRKAGGSARIVELLKEYGERIYAPDQDVLNLLAGGRVLAIHPRWNCNDGWLERQFRFSLCGKSLHHGRKPHEMLEALLDPGIIHYKGSSKPWRCNHRPERKRYEMEMRKLGYVAGRFLPGTTMPRLFAAWLFDAYHAALRGVARLRLFIWRNRRFKAVLFAVIAVAVGGIGFFTFLCLRTSPMRTGAVCIPYDTGTNTVPRILFTRDLPNMRDIGGWPTTDGRRVRYGMIYRSASFNSNYKFGRPKGERSLQISDETRQYLVGTIGIRTDLDLREAESLDGLSGSPLGREVELVNIPSQAYGDVATEEGLAALIEGLRLLLDMGNYPISVHCLGGKDRAGSFVFMVNGLLGVGEEDLRKDWLLSAHWFPSILKKNEEFDKLLHISDTYDGETLKDRLEAFVCSHGLAPEEVARLREILVE